MKRSALAIAAVLISTCLLATTQVAPPREIATASSYAPGAFGANGKPVWRCLKVVTSGCLAPPP